MQTEINIYTIQVASGYLCDMKPYIQDLCRAHPQKREGADSWYVRHYSPSGWVSSTEGEKWADYATANPAEVYEKYPYWSSFELDMDQTEFLAYCQHTEQPRITKSRVQKVTIPSEHMPEQLANQTMLMEQVLNLNERCIEQLTRASTLCFNDKVGVPQPGLGLGQYNSLMLCEDACTDRLQGYLDDGWRIIAVCPQPDSRRPDYVLGIYDKDHRTGHGAGRG